MEQVRSGASQLYSSAASSMAANAYQNAPGWDVQRALSRGDEQANTDSHQPRYDVDDDEDTEMKDGSNSTDHGARPEVADKRPQMEIGTEEPISTSAGDGSTAARGDKDVRKVYHGSREAPSQTFSSQIDQQQQQQPDGELSANGLPQPVEEEEQEETDDASNNDPRGHSSKFGALKDKVKANAHIAAGKIGRN